MLRELRPRLAPKHHLSFGVKVGGTSAGRRKPKGSLDPVTVNWQTVLSRDPKCRRYRDWSRRLCTIGLCLRIRRLGVRISSGALRLERCPVVPGLAEIEGHFGEHGSADDVAEMVLPAPPTADLKD